MIKNPVDIFSEVSILQIDFNGFNIDDGGSWIIVDSLVIPSFSLKLYKLYKLS